MTAVPEARSGQCPDCQAGHHRWRPDQPEVLTRPDGTHVLLFRSWCACPACAPSCPATVGRIRTDETESGSEPSVDPRVDAPPLWWDTPDLALLRRLLDGLHRL